MTGLPFELHLTQLEIPDMWVVEEAIEAVVDT